MGALNRHRIMLLHWLKMAAGFLLWHTVGRAPGTRWPYQGKSGAFLLPLIGYYCCGEWRHLDAGLSGHREGETK